ncbi:TolC family protein [Bacteroidales bacterium OttesenSCG-928-B11]|nr:TolC family protein [Bacteroidales bacterium OttesenSCG-928-E04]MDL2312843.1 TolC family protein [Bacteroidales bacterium OttesenSCG-928-B11]
MKNIRCNHLKRTDNSQFSSVIYCSLFFINCLILFPVLTFGQSVFTLKRCVETGLQNNYDIRISTNEQQISDNNVTPGNAGYLPVISLSADYSGNLNNLIQQYPISGGEKTQFNNVLNQTFSTGIYANWTVFEGLDRKTNSQKLRELKEMGSLNTRLTIENFIAELSAEYYNYIQQIITLENLRQTVNLSKERMRIVEERYNIGAGSRLEYQQAQVDFNTDSSRLIRQKENLFASKIRLNRLMGNQDVEMKIITADTDIVIDLINENKDQLWDNTLKNNVFLLLSEKNVEYGQLELKTLQSVNYPYLRVNAGYGYTLNTYQMGMTGKQNNLGLNYGVTLGFTIFDGMNRTRKQTNARIEIENRKLTYDNLLLELKSNFSNIWLAYLNNLDLLKLERENLTTAQHNYNIAMERYKLGDLAGIELREAQNSLLAAEERLVLAKYSTKLCELSLLQISGKITEIVD